MFRILIGYVCQFIRGTCTEISKYPAVFPLQELPHSKIHNYYSTLYFESFERCPKGRYQQLNLQDLPIYYTSYWLNLRSQLFYWDRNNAILLVLLFEILIMNICCDSNKRSCQFMQGYLDTSMYVDSTRMSIHRINLESISSLISSCRIKIFSNNKLLVDDSTSTENKIMSYC